MSSSFLVIECVFKCLQFTYNYYWCIPSLTFLMVRFIMSLVLAIKLEFVLQSAEIIYSIYPSQSLLPLVAFYHFVIPSAVHFVVTNYCYIKLAIFTSNIFGFTALSSNHFFNNNRSSLKFQWNKKPVIL
ncbi:hypothetical protein K502DRAFT_346098 [Neoconidiobolus thromboides FSU 785]|nr:hypothetical protein K502DRAFT_346098 [Neoconidiobolus thromboides FSU 785]